ncbi:hypothetical protein D3C76_1037250 [compost metagenome]
MFEVLLGQLAGYPFAGCQHHAGVDLELNVAGAADHQVHAHHLGTAGSLVEQRFIGRRAVGHCHQVAIGVVQADLSDPATAHFGRDDLLSHDD